MAEATYAVDEWSDLPHYTCLAPMGAFLHGWDCMDVNQMTTHLLEMHGLTAIEEPPPEE